MWHPYDKEFTKKTYFNFFFWDDNDVQSHSLYPYIHYLKTNWMNEWKQRIGIDFIDFTVGKKA